MLDVEEMNDGSETDALGENGNNVCLSGEARIQTISSILATAVLRQRVRKACAGNGLAEFDESSQVLGEGLDSLPEQSIHS